MRLSIITLFGVAIRLVLTDHIATSSSDQSKSNLPEANLQSPSTNVHPVASALQSPISQRPHLKAKGGYSLAPEYFKFTIESYHRNFMQLEQGVGDLDTASSGHTVPSPQVSILPKRDAEPLEGARAKEPSPAIENGNIPPNADIEEDDIYDPEEDPDDVDDPPIVNGVVVNREE